MHGLVIPLGVVGAVAADGEDVTPALAISGVTAPQDLAFDADGNLWVSALTVSRYNAARLGASTTDPADAVLTLTEESERIAFDKNGDLWSVGGSNVNLTHIAKADLGGTGASTPTPVA